MAKEHIELLEAVKAKVLASSGVSHVYICSELRDLIDGTLHFGTLHFGADCYEDAAQDITSVISCMFRGLVDTARSDYDWWEYGIAAMFDDPLEPSNRRMINKFRLVVIDALIEDFENEELGCSPTRDY